MLFIVAGVLVIVVLGLVQRLGWLSGASPEGAATATSESDEAGMYICPMMCTPPQSEPGRCPVCAMELVRSTSAPSAGAQSMIEIDPAARRIANIETVPVEAIATRRMLRTIGRLHYDEGKLKTIAAYVDGRIEQLYADYTGVVVKQGDQLALVYSPRLYSSQVELLLAKGNRERRDQSTRQRRNVQRGQGSRVTDAAARSAEKNKILTKNLSQCFFHTVKTL